jgi:hypothetical protein
MSFDTNSTACRIAIVFVGIAVAPLGCNQSSATYTADRQNSAAASTVAPNTADGKSTERNQGQVLKPGAKTVALEAAGNRSFDKTFDDLRFDIAVGQPFQHEMLPEKITALKDQRIRIRGFILPTPQQRGIKTFVLVRDNQQCCFGPGAALYDCILVEMAPGKTTEFSILPVTAEGTFDIQEVRGPDGTHLAIYHLAAESVQ